jgi:hypothetical protein
MKKFSFQSLVSHRSGAARVLFVIAVAVLELGAQVSQSGSASVAATVTLKLAWDPVPEADIQGYRLFVGDASNLYTKSYVVGTSPAYSLAGLVPGQTYYFAVEAVGSSGLSGVRSDELVVPVTASPSAVPDVYAGEANGALTVAAPGVLGNDSDIDSVRLYAALVSGPSNGAVALGPDGGFVYRPRAGFIGKDSLTYQVSDGVNVSDPALVEINVRQRVVERLVNGGFESGYTGWTVTGNQGVTLSVAPYVASGGNWLVAFNGGNLSPGGVLSQSFTTLPGRSYQLSFASAVLAYNTNAQGLQLNVVGNTNLLSQTITMAGNGNGSIQWIPRSYDFVADSTVTILSFKDVSTVTNSIDLLLDSVSITTPEESVQLLSLAETSGTPSLTGEPGSIQVGMTVTQSGSYVLERSVDLVTWKVVESTQATQPGWVGFIDSTPAGPPARVFYRIGSR